ncbi:MAG: lysine--tRNA ligase, partial [Gammaproteobacteria bacterium]|nr:lysine--tRNA ligase [Gammaproteobacteria bacterium]
MNDAKTPQEAELLAQRRAKLDELRDAGHAYRNEFRRDTLAADIHQRCGDLTAEQLEAEPIPVTVAGRMMTRRVQGKTSFAHIQDMSGQIQLYVRRDDLPEGEYANFKRWDLGDIVGVSGRVFRTQRGELSIAVEEMHLVVKALRPLPDKFHGLADTEARYRQRYLDLIMSEESRQTFVTRARVIDFIRRFLIDRGFMEVETPMMHTIPGGAAARPFVTHHNALDMSLYLRIAPELYLKRLLVGGLEKVFEINRSFRNEGLSTRHNPEFTMLEFYEAYADYQDLMEITETLLRDMTLMLFDTTKITYQGTEYDFGPAATRLTLLDAILAHNPDIDAGVLSDIDKLRTLCESRQINVEPEYGLGKLQVELFEKTAEPKLDQPTFITAYPAETSPLARRNDANPFVTDRFEYFVAGREIANGFSELNDPDDQAGRFADQVAAKDRGDAEAMHFDEDYI